jgi:hypothetical protein
LVGSWIIQGTMISVSLTGRSKGIVQIALSLIMIYIGTTLTAKFFFSPVMQRQVNYAFAAIAGVACLVVTPAVFIAARRRGLIEPPTAWAALASWALLIIAAALVLRHNAAPPAIAYTLTFGVLSLAVIPFAAAPLALSWNRHR